MQPRAAILDVDGTLVDSNYEHVRAWHEVLDEHGYHVPQAAIHRGIGMGGDKLVPHLLRCEEDDPVVKQLGEAHGERFKERYLDEIRPLPCAREFVRRLKESGYRVCLASSAHRHELDRHVEKLGVGELLDGSTCKEDVSESKPEPDIFAAACERVGVEPANAVLVGDSVWDGEAGKKLQMTFVGLLTGGFGAEELRAASAAAVYPDLRALLEEWERSPFRRESLRAAA